MTPEDRGTPARRTWGCRPGPLVLWGTTGAGFALALYGVLAGPVAPWLSVTLGVAIVGLGTLGVLVPQLGVFADVQWRGPRGARGIALTFDDGPHPATTRQVLALLAQHRCTATFFVIGAKVERHPEVLREIVAAGHGVGLHGYVHPWYYALQSPKTITADLGRARAAIEAACGVRPTLFRPPIGHVSPRVAVAARRLHLRIVAWSVRGLDGIRAEPARVARRVQRGLRDGAIVLLHDAADGDGHQPAGVEALPTVLAAIERAGLEVVPLRTLLEQPPGEAEPRVG